VDLAPEAMVLAEALLRQPARLGIDLVVAPSAPPAAGEAEAPRIYRIWRDEFDYGPETGLPPDLRPHSLERFLALGRTLVARAARAPDPPEAAALLDSGLLEPALFRDAKELERYERWWIARLGLA
jgi:hypothetical protein